MKKIMLYFVSIILLVTLTWGCATSRKIQTVQIGDNKLSCKELSRELNRLNEAQADVDSKKGMTGTNVASALFWLPGLAYTYYDAGQALEAINGRKAHLTKFYNERDCN